jgi:ligand-binding SRPBCC domain-containing protein
MAIFEAEHWVAYPRDRVFHFFANPENLPRIMPPQLGTKIVRLELIPPAGVVPSTRVNTPMAGTGSRIYVSFRAAPLFPFRFTSIAEIVEFVMGAFFVDTQVKGPFRTFRHRHEFETLMRDGIEGTIVRDAIEYDVGWGLLGSIAESGFVGKQLHKTFTHRQQVLAKMLEQFG